MGSAETVDIGQLVDEQRLSAFNLRILALMLLVLLADGYDLNAIAVVAPDIAKAWNIDRTALGAVFSAGLIGVAIGSPILGYLGDRIGRKRALVLGCCFYGLFSLCTIAANSVHALLALRFLTGLALGGAMPNVYVLAAEYAPRRFRAAFTVLAGMGVTLGAAAAGPIYAGLAAHGGWRGVFIVGGIVPFGIAIAVVCLVPESIKFLALRGDRPAEVARLAERLRPGLMVASGTRFVASAKVRSGLLPKAMFLYGLAGITVLLWTVFLMQNTTNFFVNMWMTTLFRQEGMTLQQAALTQSMYFLGANFGVLAMAVLLGRFGFAVITALVLLYLPTVAAIGMASAAGALLSALVFVAGLCNGGIYAGLSAAAVLLYPPAIRANGTGWALGVGRVGAIVGPLIGGALLAAHVSTQHIFLVLLVPLGIAVIASASITYFCFIRFGGLRLREVTPQPLETKGVLEQAPVAQTGR